MNFPNMNYKIDMKIVYKTIIRDDRKNILAQPRKWFILTFSLKILLYNLGFFSNYLQTEIKSDTDNMKPEKVLIECKPAVITRMKNGMYNCKPH